MPVKCSVKVCANGFHVICLLCESVKVNGDQCLSSSLMRNSNVEHLQTDSQPVHLWRLFWQWVIWVDLSEGVDIPDFSCAAGNGVLRFYCTHTHTHTHTHNITVLAVLPAPIFDVGTGDAEKSLFLALSLQLSLTLSLCPPSLSLSFSLPLIHPFLLPSSVSLSLSFSLVHFHVWSHAE